MTLLAVLKSAAAARSRFLPVTTLVIRKQSTVTETAKPSTNYFSSDEDGYFSPIYRDEYLKSINFPEEYWSEVAQGVQWMRKWDKVLDSSNPPFHRWFVGGSLNVCYNAVDRHAESAYKDKIAVIHESPVTGKTSKLSWVELKDQVSRFAGVLSGLGVQKGDRVVVYMPMIPEAVVTMLACARLGAVHSVVFGGFSARELATRLEHADPKVIVGVNCSVERNKILNFKTVIDEAIEIAGNRVKHTVIYNRPSFEPAKLQKGWDVDWERAMDSAIPHHCVPVDANDPLYILYTSGTTGQPKGVVRPAGGHAVVLPWTMEKVYGMKKNEVWWAASDLGWVVGHSYICYGPLLSGITTVLYEGKPVGTPDASQFFRVVHDHGVNGMFTAPTALRAIKAEDPDCEMSKKFSRDTLRGLFVAGEHCDYETREWAERAFKVPVLDNWWQTETGHAISASCVGLGNKLKPPKDVSGMPLPGYDVRVMRADRTEAQYGEMGRIVVRLPLPPGNFTTLYKSPERYVKTYFSEYPGFYDTADAGFKDEHGYICVMARDDDVINVAGHRLSTSALEEAILEHSDVIDCAVVGVPDELKGEVPLALFVEKTQSTRSEEDIVKELREMVREIIGPVAAFRLAVRVPALPRTRSGKTPRKTIADLAKGKKVTIPGTIEDPTVYPAIKEALQKLGYAVNAPDPE